MARNSCVRLLKRAENKINENKCLSKSILIESNTNIVDITNQLTSGQQQTTVPLKRLMCIGRNAAKILPV